MQHILNQQQLTKKSHFCDFFKFNEHTITGDSMLYLNYIFFYSIFGFLMESTIYKITKVNNKSGIFYGPYTFVYGFGVLASILIFDFLEKRTTLKNKFLKLIMYYIIFTVIMSLIEFIGGELLHLIFNQDLWNYSSHADSIGKYICITNSLIWGVLSTFNIYIIYPKVKKILKKLPHIYTYIILLGFIIDLIFTIINKVL